MPRGRLLCRAGRGDAGFGLVDALTASVVLMVLSAAVLTVLVSALRTGQLDRRRVAASNLAAREIEAVRDQFALSNAGALTVATQPTVVNGNPLDAVTGTNIVDGTEYTVTRDVQWLPAGNGASACDGGTLVTYPSLRLTVTVTWPGMTTKPVRPSTLLTPSKDIGDTATTFLAVKVTNAAGRPSVNVPVQATGPGGTYSHTTDDSGCVVFAWAPRGDTR